MTARPSPTRVVPDRVVVVGGGIAGLSTALYLAPLPTTVLSSTPLLTGSSTGWAQGGIAAALGEDDTPALHAADTLLAGAGLSDPDVAARVAAVAPARIDDLLGWGVAFDRNANGSLALGLEAAHCRSRIVHAGGDATGRAVLEALVAAARSTPSIELHENVDATDIVLDDDGHAAGVLVGSKDATAVLPARGVVLATGGIGGLYAATTNPLGAVGSGVAMAARAGAILRHLEFVQFHPTALTLGLDPMPLASEAIRGEGAVLIDDRGERFLADVSGAELAPRDVVAQAVWAKIAAGRRVYLDARTALGADFAARFPQAAAACRTAGLDPASQPIPVAPAAHYHMGGIAVDGRGRSSLRGLWAGGEVAATGLHGANRLASNSLIEALAFAGWIADDLSGCEGSRAPVRLTRPRPRELGRDGPRLTAELRRLMTKAVGVAREARSLRQAIARLASLRSDRALVGLLVAVAALRREASQGAHYRSDAPRSEEGRPDPHEGWRHDGELTLAEALDATQALEPERACS
ncbi:MAG: L-aspartate oxidase [Pseudomonadota bacterium]